MIIHKTYIDTTEENKKIQISVTYSKGESYGYREVKRGYTLHVQPVEISGYFVKYIPTEGYKYFLLEVSRQSKKADTQAIELSNNIKDDIIQRVLKDKNWLIQ